MYKNKYGYSQVRIDDIKSVFTLVSVKCLTCDTRWNVSIFHHLNGSEYPKCVQYPTI